MTSSSPQRLWGGEPDGGARESWERRTEWPLAILAILFLVTYSCQVLWVSASPGARLACDTVDFVTYCAFVADYVIRLRLSRNRIGFLRHSALDLLVLILPMLRPLRTLRLVTLLRLIDRRIGRTLRGQIVAYLALATALILYVAALAVLEVERGAPGGNIRNLPDALWWAATTITTVGYGEHHPVTGAGRIIAVALMFSGIAMLGVVTASIASWMVERLREAEDEVEALTRSEIQELTEEVRALRTEISRLKIGAEEENQAK